MRIRPAENHGVETMVRIISHYALQGLMLPRSHGALQEALGDYLVADENGALAGCGGLEQYTNDTAEIYGLATSPDKSIRAGGSTIVQALMERARTQKILLVFAALTLAPAFFQKMGFRTVEHKDCPKYGNCDEIAVVLDLN